jgi:hypothetical protein
LRRFDALRRQKDFVSLNMSEAATWARSA